MDDHPASLLAPVGTAVIVARSERQAMDWSLVLASQGIDLSLERLGDPPQWSLVVAAHDEKNARRAIQLFRLENRRFSWRKEVPIADVPYHAGALLWVFALVVIHAVSDQLRKPAAFYSDAVGHGEWWRAFTAVWLHSDMGHLVANSTIGAIVLGLAMAQYGAGPALLMGLLAGAAGNFVSFFAHPEPYVGLGASGMVMGAVGMLAARAVALWRLSRHATRTIIGALLAGGFLFLILGTNPRSDIAAHTGGFIAGFALGALATWLRWERFGGWALAGFWVLTLGTWWRAKQ